MRRTRFVGFVASFALLAACSSSQKTAPAALVRLDAEPPGANCPTGGTAIRSGVDLNDDGVLQGGEVTATEYVCGVENVYRSGWAANATPAYGSGFFGAAWTPVGREATIFKTSAATRLRITVSDSLRVGYQVEAAQGAYGVRMNGMNIGCNASTFMHSPGSAQNFVFPHAQVCLTEALPQGLYRFEAWAMSNSPLGAATGQFAGTGMVGWPEAGTKPVLLVEEVTGDYAWTTDGPAFATTVTTFVKAPGREVSYTKRGDAASTLLKVTLSDTLRGSMRLPVGSGGVAIQMDGEFLCTAYKHVSTGGAINQWSNFHNPFVITCLADQVAPGVHTFSVWVRAHNGAAGDLGQLHLGYRSAPLLLVEELPRIGRSWSTHGNEVVSVSDPWNEVPGRGVTHTVSAAGKTLKVTYSDTFAGVMGCSKAAGFFQLYVDGQPTGCMNGAYMDLAAGLPQWEYLPINLTCLVPGLAPGGHAFDMYWTTYLAGAPQPGCAGDNSFGWGRSQALLLVEELP